jgi:hypothetical protein
MASQIASEQKQPLHRTQLLAAQLMLGAVREGSETTIEITKAAIAIFCQCTLDWCLNARNASHASHADEKELSTPASLKAAIGKAIQKEAAGRVFQMLYPDDFQEDLAAVAQPESCSSSASVGAKDPHAFIAARAELDDSTRTLLQEMIGACSDVTDQLLESEEFASDLAEWGANLADDLSAPQ